MKTRLLTLLVFALLTALVVIFAPKREIPEQIPTPAHEIPADYDASGDFRFQDAMNVSMSLSDFAGQPAVALFWASWNEQSREMLDLFEKSWLKNGGGVVYLGVNLGKAGKDGLKKALRVYEDGGYTFPLYVDKTGVVSYNITTAPQLYFFAPDGKLLRHIDGAFTADQLADGVSLISGSALPEEKN